MDIITKDITPLPWYYGKTDIGPYDWALADCELDPEGRITIGSTFIAEVLPNCTPERTQANARYIRATANNMPAILKALAHCLSIVRIQNGNLHEDTNKIQNDANEAIQKLFEDLGLTYEWNRV